MDFLASNMHFRFQSAESRAQLMSGNGTTGFVETKTSDHVKQMIEALRPISWGNVVCAGAEIAGAEPFAQDLLVKLHQALNPRDPVDMGPRPLHKMRTDIFVRCLSNTMTENGSAL